MRYKNVVVTRRGGPEVLEVVENDLRDPSVGEARIRVLAAPVCLPDVQARYGQSPFPPKPPYVPGYAIIGNVEATGRDVHQVAVGDRVAALTIHGGYSEVIYLDQGKLIHAPTRLDPAEAVLLMLNYVLAYQLLHRTAKVKPGDKALIIGASGGIGTAFLQLGRLAGLRMYGIASRNKHNILYEYGATPIDYHTQDFVEVIHQMEPEGLDVIFDGMGGDYIDRAFSVLRRGGMLVEYANPLGYSGMFRLLGKVILFNLLPNGKKARLYGNSSVVNQRPFLEDWAVLFKLLEEGKIKPVIYQKFPILEAAKANALLESGQVIGNIVLVAS